MDHVLLLLLLVAAACGQPTESVRHPEDNLIVKEVKEAVNESSVALPEPVSVSFELSHSDDASVKAGAVRVEIDTDGVPVVHGVRLPDDPNDKTIWRNARVLNNKLVTDKVPDMGDMFIYRPENGRALNDGFSPSQSDDSFKPSMPFPAFYYSNYYNGKSESSPLPDTIGVESAEPAPSVASAEEKTDSDKTDGRGKIFFGEAIRQGASEPVPIPAGQAAAASVQSPNYFVPSSEAASIHDDHSPYDFEPTADPTTYESSESYAKNHQAAQEYQYYQPNPVQTAQQQYQQQQYQQQQAYPHRTGYVPNYYQQNVPAASHQYVIQQQLYSTGNGGAFSVPVPIPQGAQYQYVYPQRPQRQRPSVDYGALFKTQLTKGIEKIQEKIHDVTSPVVDPLAEAGQKISTNLGIPERIHKINEKVATPSVIVPLALASGAALAIGGLSTAAAFKNNREETLTKLGIGQLETVLKRFEAKQKEGDKKEATAKATQSTDVKTDVKTEVPTEVKTDVKAEDKSSEVKSSEVKEEVAQSRDRRSLDDDQSDQDNLLDDILSRLNNPQRSFLTHLQRMGFDQWREAGCAKRIFCDVMTQQSDDAVALMEKRMSTFLTLLDSGLSHNLQALTSDVMEAVRRRNCLSFVCSNSLDDSPSSADSSARY